MLWFYSGSTPTIYSIIPRNKDPRTVIHQWLIVHIQTCTPVKQREKREMTLFLGFAAVYLSKGTIIALAAINNPKEQKHVSF